MSGRVAVTVHFDAEVSLEDRGGYWAAWIKPLGTWVYGDTREAVEHRVEEGIKFFLKHIPDVPQYLASHGVPHQVNYITEPDTETDGQTPVLRTYPVGALVESVAHA